MSRPVLWSKLGAFRHYVLTVFMAVAPTMVAAYAVLQVETIPHGTALPAASKVFFAGIVFLMVLIIWGVFTIVVAFEDLALERESRVFNRVRADREARTQREADKGQ